mmetsp:Transcript_24992/g.42780  ORF Transcript_24992/g.42780 Transcript_24992/m.42780 type:complete len:283 (-) Transcript_24992:621-1469(-)
MEVTAEISEFAGASELPHGADAATCLRRRRGNIRDGGLQEHGGLHRLQAHRKVGIILWAEGALGAGAALRAQWSDGTIMRTRRHRSLANADRVRGHRGAEYHGHGAWGTLEGWSLGLLAHRNCEVAHSCWGRGLGVSSLLHAWELWVGKLTRPPFRVAFALKPIKADRAGLARLHFIGRAWWRISPVCVCLLTGVASTISAVCWASGHVLPEIAVRRGLLRAIELNVVYAVQVRVVSHRTYESRSLQTCCGLNCLCRHLHQHVAWRERVVLQIDDSHRHCLT